MNFAHIVFLDFDGPLYPEKILLLPENNDNTMLQELNLHPMVTYWKMEPCIIAMLNQLYELRPFFIVVSSSWANLHSKEQIETLFATNGLNIPMHEDWKIELGNYSKIVSIENWLKNKKIADYMIIDDDESGEDFLAAKKIENSKLIHSQIILLSSEDGITMSNYFKMKAIVANWN